MKKIAILVASVLVLGGFGTRAYADGVDTQTTQAVDSAISYKQEAGITPDSLLYSIDKAIDQLRVMLANSEEKKAEVNADIAQERLGESEVMTEKGKIELALKALAEYNAKITEAANKLQAVVTNLEAVAAGSSDKAVEEAAVENSEEVAVDAAEAKLEQSITDLEKVIQEVQAKSLVVLDSIKNVASDDSMEAVEEAIEVQTTHKEAVASFVKERHEFNAAKKSLNMARVAAKKVEKSGNAEAVKAAQEKLAAAQKEYMAAQTELHASFQAKKAADLGIEVSKEEVKTEESIQTSTETVATTEENKQTIETVITTEETKQAVEGTATTKAAVTVEAGAKAVEYIKTNNGNGNGNKSVKIEKEDKEKQDKEKVAPGKSGEAPGKSGQSNGKNK